jgi:molybdopterin synthase sulfur carrier subunit
MDGDTLGQIIESMDSSYPGFKDRLVDEDGEIRYFVNIYLNGEDVRFLQGMETTTKTGDEVSIVPAVAGGAT